MNISIALGDIKIPSKVITRIKSFGNLNVFSELKLSEEEVIRKMCDTEILICRSTCIKRLNKTIFDGLNKLRFVSIYGSGYDWIDTIEASKKQIIISNTNNSNSISVAEHIWGMILNLSKRISEVEQETKKLGCPNLNQFRGVSVSNKTIGIIGTGKIGKNVAKIAKGFCMNIIGINKSGQQVEGIRKTSLDYLLKNSDIITLCIPLNENTLNYISSKELNMMKSKTILVNCAREKLVNKKDVITAIATNKIFGYAVETDILIPIQSCDDYFKYPNIIVTPHNAWNTEETYINSFSTIINNVEAFLCKKPINVINDYFFHDL